MAAARCAARAVEAVLDARRPGVLALDTETTSLRGSVIQAAVVALDARGAEGEVTCALVAPPAGEALDPAATRVHGITRARLAREAVDAPPFFRAVVGRIKRARAEGTRVVAHNAAFDVARLNATLAAHGLAERLAPDDVFCTMRAAKRHCGLRDARGRARCPKNAELYALLHGGARAEALGGALHDAAADARVTAHAYLAGRRRGWWR